MFEKINKLPHVFKPEIDDFTEDPFIPRNPWDMIESGDFNQVPVIMGSNSDEGLFSAFFFHNNQTLLEELAEKWESEYAPLIIFHRLVFKSIFKISILFFIR